MRKEEPCRRGRCCDMAEAKLADSADLDTFIKKLRIHVGKHWKKVARELSFSRTDIDAIVHREKDDLKEQIYLFFEDWKRKDGSGATVQKLIMAIKAAELEPEVLAELQHVIPELKITGSQPAQIQQDGVSNHARDDERELIRKKRLERLQFDQSSSLAKLETAERRPHDDTFNSSVDAVSPSNTQAPSTASRQKFELGDLVKVERKPKPWYGVVKWIGDIPTVPDVAGIEMEDVVEGGHSGEYKGKFYFKCEDGHGVILPLSRLTRDDRFGPPTLKGGPTAAGEEVEKDKDMPHVYPQQDACISPKAFPLTSSPKINQKEGIDAAFTFESSEGATSSSEGAMIFSCPGDVAGFIIGKDGKNLRDVESKTGTDIKVQKNERDTAANTNVTIFGDKESCQKAFLQMVHNIRRKTALHTATTVTIQIPSQSCGRVIGKKGANVQAIQNLTGARIKIERRQGIEAMLNPDGPSNCEITGSADQIEKAKEMIQMSVEGEDIAQAASIAAMIMKMMKELKAEGYKFGSI